MKDNWFQRYVLPGFIFQSAVIGGAYGSGKELQEFFLGHGPVGGLLGMAVTMVVFSLVLMAAYEFARKFRLFDYRSFCKALLGRAWPLYEILYVLMMILVISVVGAAAGDILKDTFGLPAFVGTGAIMVLTALLVFYGTPAVEKFLAPDISANLSAGEIGGGWIKSGIAFSGYNMAAIPAILFCIRHQHRRREAVIAGALAGPIAMVPAMLFFVAMIGQYDQLAAVGDNGPLPITVLMGELHGAGFFIYLFPVVLFGTFVETGAAMIHGVNERLDHTFAEKSINMPNWVRPVVAMLILFTAVILADAVGLAGLIAKGYGTITYGFLLVFVLPLLTWGVYLIWRANQRGE
jgi:uncharacterized membrane protein YkvI